MKTLARFSVSYSLVNRAGFAFPRVPSLFSPRSLITSRSRFSSVDFYRQRKTYFTSLSPNNHLLDRKLLYFLSFTGGSIAIFTLYSALNKKKKITVEDFFFYLKENKIFSVTFYQSRLNSHVVLVKFKDKKECICFVNDLSGFIKRIDEIQKEFPQKEKLIKFTVPREYSSNSLFSAIKSTLRKVFSSNGKASSQGHLQNNIKKGIVIEFTVPKTTYKDIAGLDKIKETLENIMNCLKDPSKYDLIDAKIPNCVMINGAASTGKNLLIESTAGEFKFNYIYFNGKTTDIMANGEGVERMKAIFAKARTTQNCLIHIDEIDSFGNKGNNNIEKKKILAQLLEEIDKLKNCKIVVFASTLNSSNLESSLFKFGRFNKTITLQFPKLEDRKKIYALYLRKVPLEEGVNAEDLADQICRRSSMSGESIRKIANDAKLISIEKGKKFVDIECLQEAYEKHTFGINMIHHNYQKEREATAIHEAGHCIVNWFSPNAFPVYKVTILPMGKSLGMTMGNLYSINLKTQSSIMDWISVCLGGRASEITYLGSPTSGCQSDITTAYTLARQIVVDFGMTDVGMMSNSTYNSKKQTEIFENKIEEEVQKILKTCQNRAIKLLKKKKREFNKIVELLLEKETIYEEDIERILGKRPGKIIFHD